MERRTSDVATAFRRLLRVQLLLTPGLQKRVLVLSLPVNVTERERDHVSEILKTSAPSVDSNRSDNDSVLILYSKCYNA